MTGLLFAVALALVVIGAPLGSWLFADPAPAPVDPTRADVAYGARVAAGRTRGGVR